MGFRWISTRRYFQMTGLAASTTIRLLGCAALIEALLLTLRLQGDLRYCIPETVGLLLLISILYLISVYLVLRPDHGEKSRADRKLVLVVAGAAVIFRLTVWPMAPALSDDVFRYRWEGMVQAEGGNPYQVRPIDDEWTHLRDETWPRVGSKDVKAGYGPLIELMQRGLYRVVSAATADPVRQAFWFKAPAALFDLGVMLVLAALLAAHGLAPGRLLIYAWSPLVLMEYWATGHNDAVAVFFVVGALALAARKHWTWAFVSLSLGVGAKFWPVILFPVFIGWRGWRPLRWHQWLVLAPVSALLAWPYWSNVRQNAEHMSGFVGGWRNNDSLYGLLLWITGDQYPAKYTAFAIVALTAVAVTLLRWPLERASLTILTVLLMVSANCHPWYLTWLAPLLAVAPVPALLLWTALMPLVYRVVIAWALLGEWEGSTPWRWLVYVPVFGLLAGTALVKGVRRLRAGGAGADSE